MMINCSSGASIKELETDETKRILLLDNLQKAYSGSSLNNNVNYDRLLGNNISLIIPDNSTKKLAKIIIGNALNLDIKNISTIFNNKCPTGTIGTYNSSGLYIVDRSELDNIIEGSPLLNGTTGEISVSQVCTTQITDMSYLFEWRLDFNDDISNFDTSNVTDMKSMFNNARAFNQPLDNFDTSNVTDMSLMFYMAESFNQSLDNFNTSNVTNMDYMFFKAESFNQTLNNFNTSNVIFMTYMFNSAVSFNQPLNNFDTSNVAMINGMFLNAISYLNHNMSSWNTTNILPSGYSNFITGAGPGNTPPTF